MDITPVVKRNNDRVLRNNIKNIQTNLSLMDKYKFENISDVNHGISNIEEKKKVNFKQIKLIEERHIKNKIIYDLTEEYIRHKPAYVNYKQKTGIKTNESTEFVRIYNVLKNFEIDNETKILDFRSAFDDIQEDLQNDITDFKEQNKNLNKEKFKIEKIKETVKDMTENKYDLKLRKNKESEKNKINKNASKHNNYELGK